MGLMAIRMQISNSYHSSRSFQSFSLTFLYDITVCHSPASITWSILYELSKITANGLKHEEKPEMLNMFMTKCHEIQLI